MKEYLIHYFERYLNQLKEEINAYPEESKLWITAKQINNSAGNLCYHLIGNLNHFIGAVIGETGYIRNRPLEFSIKDFPISEMNEMIDDTIVMIKSVITEADLSQPYPWDQYQKQGDRLFFLLRFLAHLSYHVGQINYHRRLLTDGE